MKFVALEYLWILWLVPLVLFFFIWTGIRRRKKTEMVISRDLWSRMMPEFRPRMRTFKAMIVLGGIFFLCIALLRPQWGYQIKEIKRRGIDIYILVDTSDSMRAEDIQPSRMERAKRELIDLLAYLHGDRIGLIAFAGRSFVACPLTVDYSAYRLFIDELDTDLIPLQGTDIASALDKGLESFDPGDTRSKAIILITDGEQTEGSIANVTQKAKDMGVRVFIIGMGSEKGAPIPLKEGDGFKKDKNGDVVISRLHEESLQKLALATGGTYVRSVTGDLDLEQIYLKGIKQVLEEKELKSEQKIVGEERFQIPLFFAILLLMLEPVVRESNKPLNLHDILKPVWRRKKG